MPSQLLPFLPRAAAGAAILKEKVMSLSIQSLRNVLVALMVGLLVGCAGAFTKTGQALDDTAITAKVKAAMAKDKDVSATGVSVETVKGEVRLSGFVKSSAEKQRAEQLAMQTDGVKSVANGLIVRAE
jgi:osmotically-inducible protein OsmY